MNDIGQRITEYRKRAALTQIELAETLGISQPMIALYESGKRKLPLDLLIPISESLSVPVNILLNVDSEEKSPSKIEERFQKISNLSRRKQERILSVIDTLLADSAKS